MVLVLVLRKGPLNWTGLNFHNPSDRGVLKHLQVRLVLSGSGSGSSLSMHLRAGWLFSGGCGRIGGCGGSGSVMSGIESGG